MLQAGSGEANDRPQSGQRGDKPAPERPAEPPLDDSRTQTEPTARRPAIELDGVSRRFGSLWAARELSLAVPEGTLVGIVGPSGAGKTTTIRMLTGGIRPTTGRIRVLGEEPSRFSGKTREQIGYMPQLYTLYPDLTARENVDFVASLYGLLPWRRRQQVGRVLKLVDLWAARGRRASELSGGMQRRLALACALVHDPQLIFLDEPSAGVDPMLRQHMWDELHRMRDEGRTLLVTTQYVTEAEECDQVALISEGRLVAVAGPDELRHDAMRGEVLEVETDRVVDAATLIGLDEVREVRQRGPRSLLVFADDAGAASPVVVSALDRSGVNAVSVREFRPTFEEVFAELVSRARGDAAAARRRGARAS